MIELWTVEFCTNDLGVWDRMWFLTEEEAADYYLAFVKEHGLRYEQTGEDGDCYPPARVGIEPNAQGLLWFANAYAVDSV